MIENGTYRIFQDGKLLGEGKNLITTSGKRLIASYVAGAAPSWAGAIAVGTTTTAATASDKHLGFEITRAEIKARSVNFGGGTAGAHRIILKGTLDAAVAGQINELGIYSQYNISNVGVTETVLIGAGDSGENWTYHNGTTFVATIDTPNTTDNKLGLDGITMTSTGVAKRYRLPNLQLDLSQYGNTDNFLFATKVISGTLTGMQVKFNTDDSNYYSYTFPTMSAFATTSYAAVTFSKSLWTATGTPNWNNITSVEFIVTSTTSVNLMIDGIRVQDEDSVDPDYALVSHSILGSSITKSGGSPMEIEYYCDL
jgi:hypothetical protein